MDNQTPPSLPDAMLNNPQLPPGLFRIWLLIARLPRQRGLLVLELEPFCRSARLPRATLYKYLALLRANRVLDWLSDRRGSLYLDLQASPAPPAEPAPDPSPPTPVGDIFLSTRSESSAPLKNMNPNPKRLTIQREDKIYAASPNSTPADLYHWLTHRRPSQSQRQEINSRVTSLETWQQTIQHWTLHNWNPGNVAGLLDLYGRGGADACHRCKQTPLNLNDQNDQTLAELCQEFNNA